MKVGGLSISDFTGLSLNRALNSARELKFTAREALIAERIRKEVVERLEFLAGVGLSYLSLDRNAATFVRRGGPADPAGYADWLAAARSVVCAG